MTVFIAQGWTRWPLRCRARELAAYGWNVREPWKEGDQTPARMPCEARKRQAWACPAKRVSAKQGRADGSSACPGGSPFEPGGVSTKATIPGDMQQTGQIHPRAERWRRTSSVARFGSVMGWTTARVPQKHAGCPYQNMRAPRARFSPSRSARPFRGKRNLILREWGKPQARGEPASPGAG